MYVDMLNRKIDWQCLARYSPSPIFFVGIHHPSEESWLGNKPSKAHHLEVKARTTSYPWPFAPAHGFSMQCSWVLKHMW